MHRYLHRKADPSHRSPLQKASTNALHPRPVLSHCPLSCLTLEPHEFLMADTVTVGIVYWPRCAIFSALLSRRGGEVAAGRNMTLMCQSQRPRLAQRLSILRRDQQFFFSKTARSLRTRNHCGRRAAPPTAPSRKHETNPDQTLLARFPSRCFYAGFGVSHLKMG